MALENKLGIKNSAELAGAEEKMSKLKAIELYESNMKGIDASYHYEGYNTFKSEDLQVI